MDNHHIERNWRDSLVTKLTAYVLSGALVLGAGKLVYEINEKKSQENCENYGWLMGQPVEVQRDSIRNDLERRFRSYRSPLTSQTMKNWNIDLIIADLKRNCRPNCGVS